MKQKVVLNFFNCNANHASNFECNIAMRDEKRTQNLALLSKGFLELSYEMSGKFSLGITATYLLRVIFIIHGLMDVDTYNDTCNLSCQTASVTDLDDILALGCVRGTSLVPMFVCLCIPKSQILGPSGRI